GHKKQPLRGDFSPRFRVNNRQCPEARGARRLAAHYRPPKEKRRSRGPAASLIRSSGSAYGLTGALSSSSEAMTAITPAAISRPRIQPKPLRPSASATDEALRASATAAGAATAAVDPKISPAETVAKSALRITI